MRLRRLLALHCLKFPHFQVTLFMSRRKRKTDELKNLAADFGREDGSDPKEFHSKPWNAPKKAGRKGQQLCEQVKQALLGAIPACGDPVLQSLEVLGVEPAPHSGRLRVLFNAPTGVERGTLTCAISRGIGFLRREVAAAINRRHVPELVFEFIGW